jgi:hypothetical protein
MNRDTLWECMKEFNIPTKVIHMCKTCVPKTRSAGRIAGTMSCVLKIKQA